WKRHCSIYPLTDTFLAAHAGELTGYGRTKGSLHFTPEKPLPEALVVGLARARLADLGASSAAVSDTRPVATRSLHGRRSSPARR
ncbi:MAG: hypothetical protein ACRDGJ_08710, partial [Candidatus Limnocylindria bacterium]